MWRSAFIVWLALAASPAGSMDAASEFGAKRLPRAPTLIENHSPELCGPILESALKALRSSEPAPSLTKKDLDYVNWVEWQQSQPLESSGRRVYRLDVDLDGTGAQQSILYRISPHSWRGDWHHAYVLPDGAALKSLAESGQLFELLPDPFIQYEPAVDLLELRQFFPAQIVNGVLQSTGNVWSELQLFRWQDRVYLLDQSSEWDRLPPLPVTVYRVRADATLERQCVLDFPNRKEQTAAALRASGLAMLLRQLEWVAGNGMGACGTLNAEAAQFDAAMAASRNAVVRPWAVSIHDPSFDWYGKYHVYDERLLAFLQDWSLGSAWNRTVYLELKQHIAHATRDYGDTLQREFGVSSRIAAARAEAVVENLVAAWIQVPNGYVPGQDLYTLEQSEITLALLARDAAALDDALKDRQALHSAAPIYAERNPPVSVIALSMHDAVIWPKALDALLLAGAAVDARNVFGKTPLMTAAHLNRPDAVRALLQRGVDPKARTDAAFQGCGYSIERGLRTALMYAAENAGIETIRILLDAGADPEAKDSKENGLDFYLANNPRSANCRI